MINHYIDLHEYINENIYRLPVKENQIITEAIDWGGVIKNTLIGGGIIGLIILLLKILTGNTSSGSSGGGGGSSSGSSSSSSTSSSNEFIFKLNDSDDEFKKVNTLITTLNHEKNISFINLFVNDKITDKFNELKKSINKLFK